MSGSGMNEEEWEISGVGLKQYSLSFASRNRKDESSVSSLESDVLCKSVQSHR